MFETYDDMLSIDDLCAILTIGKNTAYNILNSGELKCFRIGKVWKIPKQGLIDYITHSSGF